MTAQAPQQSRRSKHARDAGSARDHPRRLQILGLVESLPGISIQGVAERLDLSRRATDYHVGWLCREERLSCRRHGRRTSLFVRGQEPDQPPTAMERSTVERRVWELARLTPPLTHERIGKMMGLSRSRITHILTRLRREGDCGKAPSS